MSVFRTALVTGGAGFIGSHLVDQLIAEGTLVTVIDDFSSGHALNLAEAHKTGKLRFIEGSIMDHAALASAMHGADVVFHMAVECVRRSLGNPLRNHEVNATGTLRVLEAARTAKVKRFIYCSSSEVYGNASSGMLSEDITVCAPVTIYGAAKFVGEHYTHAYRTTYGLSTMVVRPFNAYGPREHHKGDLAEVIPRFMIRVLNGLPPIVFGNGSQGRDFTHVTEVARGLILASKCDGMIGQTTNIAYGRMVTILELAERIMGLTGNTHLRPQCVDSRPGDVHRLHADTRKAMNLFGFSASIKIEDGLEQYISWFKAQYPDPSKLIEQQLQNWEMPA
jgi:UDP-glucose 4-epimerase